MRRIIPFVLFIAIPTAASLAQTRSKTLDIYDIDTEGGHAVLFVSPCG